MASERARQCRAEAGAWGTGGLEDRADEVQSWPQAVREATEEEDQEKLMGVWQWQKGSLFCPGAQHVQKGVLVRKTSSGYGNWIHMTEVKFGVTT